MKWRAMLREALRERHIAYFAPDLARALALPPLVDHCSIICSDAMGVEALEGAQLLEVGPHSGGDAPTGAMSLLKHPQVHSFVANEGITDALVFKLNHSIARLAHQLGMEALGGDPVTAQRFENKVRFTAIAKQLGLPTPRWIASSEGLPNYTQAVRELGEALVVQAARGHSGQTTWRVGSSLEYETLSEQLRGRPTRVGAYLEGITWSLNGCALGTGQVAIGQPFVQLTGHPLCTPHSLGACGNVWCGESPHHQAVVDAGLRVGEALAREGYRGAFGVDILLDQAGAPFVIEVNPRITSGLSFESLFQFHEGGLPGLALHLLAQLYPQFEMSTLSPENPGRQASQAVLYNRCPERMRVSQSLRAGRYSLIDGELCWVDEELRSTHCEPHQAILLARSVGRQIAPGAELARVQVPRSWSTSDEGTLSSEGEAWVQATLKRIETQPLGGQ